MRVREREEKGKERIGFRDPIAKEKGPESKVEGHEQKKEEKEEGGCKTQGWERKKAGETLGFGV